MCPEKYVRIAKYTAVHIDLQKDFVTVAKWTLEQLLFLFLTWFKQDYLLVGSGRITREL